MSDVMTDLEESPNNWRRVELGSICNVVGGFAAPKGEEPFKDGSVPFVRMQDLGRYHRTTNLTETKNSLNSDYVRKNKLRQVPNGSVLIPRSGSVSLNHRAILGADACIVSHICALTLRTNDIDNRYLYYALCNFDMRKIMRKTTGLDAITFEDVKRIHIPLPPLNTQVHIVHILQKVEYLQQKRRQANQLANEIIQSVFLKMFGDPATNPNGWNIGKLENDLIDVIYRYPSFYNIEYLDSGVPVLKVENVSKDGYLDRGLNSIKCITQETSERFPKTILIEDDLIMAVRGATIGKVAVVPKAFEGSNINPNLIRISTKRKHLSPVYLWAYLNLPIGRTEFAQKVTNTAKATITVPNILALEIPLPPIQLQDRFSAIVKKIWALRESQQRSSREINELFHSLMQKGFRGELRIAEITPKA